MTTLRVADIPGPDRHDSDRDRRHQRYRTGHGPRPGRGRRARRLAVRSAEKGDAAAAGTPGGPRSAARPRQPGVRAGIRRRLGRPVDLLINNAGVGGTDAGPHRRRLRDAFGTNHLGHFALTNLLLEHITGRIVTRRLAGRTVRGRLDFDDLNWRRGPTRATRAYNDSKLANLLFTAELQRRLTAAGSGVLAYAAHPGLVATNIYHRDRAPPPGRPAVGGRFRLLAQNAGRARFRCCTPLSPTSPATVSPGPATSRTCAAPPSSSPAPPPRRIRTSHAACGRPRNSSPGPAFRFSPSRPVLTAPAACAGGPQHATITA